VQGAAFGGAKIWNSEIWPLLTNWQLCSNTDTCRKCEQQFSLWQLQLINLSSIALRNYTPQLSVGLLFIVCTNATWGRQQRRLPRTANTLAPPLTILSIILTGVRSAKFGLDCRPQPSLSRPRFETEQHARNRKQMLGASSVSCPSGTFLRNWSSLGPWKNGLVRFV